MTNKIKLFISLGVLAGIIALAALLYGVLNPVAQERLPDANSNSNSTDRGTGAVDRTLAPDFAVTTGDGSTAKLSDFKGKPVVLNFWASWCPPCKSEMPHFDKVYGEYKEDVVFLMVDLTDGQRETIESGKKYVQEQGYGFPVYFDTTGEASEAYGVDAIPMTVFIDAEGYVVSKARGAVTEKKLRQGVAEINAAQ